MIEKILLQSIECGSPEACAEITKIQYESIKMLINVTLYLMLGLITVKVINDMSYNIFGKLSMLGISKGKIYFVKFFLYCVWPVLWVSFMYGFTRSKIEGIRNDK